MPPVTRTRAAEFDDGDYVVMDRSDHGVIEVSEWRGRRVDLFGADLCIVPRRLTAELRHPHPLRRARNTEAWLRFIWDHDLLDDEPEV